MSQGRLTVLLMCLIPSLVAGSATSTAETQSDDAEAALVARGDSLFRVYCANCHGENGRGDGPTAEALLVKPADLTLIAKRNGGRFSAEQVSAKIDGREESKAHGARQMPIWGIALQDWERDTNQESEVASRLEQLVHYLRSIQAAPAD